MVQPTQSGSRALVLGGGGVTGIAWEVGVLAGLSSQGIDWSKATSVIGTSAGSFVGTAVAAGYDLEWLFAAQLVPDENEVDVKASEDTMAAWWAALAEGGDDPRQVGAAMGRIAKAAPEPVPAATRRRVVGSRLVTAEWPNGLKVTAIDADTGGLKVFDQHSGVPLIDAVSASGAVPGVWPLEHFQGRSWVDGGMVSTTNARQAEGHDRIVILAPMPSGYGKIPGAAEDAEVLAERAEVCLVAPDEQSVEAIGPNPYDPQRRKPAAQAGRAQGEALAGKVSKVWNH
ncbi:patatin-like phospholipase family protein [Amycolatopsis acidicola]|uniref:Patatin-like phospholipase family protein n=1 Tax=Amycolatopsis acidicola TaxID=2596893 RepID=A0A5N0VJI4_9PSEU|nr:patatin-like phospholipase family protein [Amycolatopsis acidicola]KAA9165524.1 patatin-like phospholipase family protein [Amycolatopsis acidicola]